MRRWWHRRPAARYMLTITDEQGREHSWMMVDGLTASLRWQPAGRPMVLATAVIERVERGGR